VSNTKRYYKSLPSLQSEAAEYDIFSGGFDKNGSPYISKIGHSPSLKVRRLSGYCPSLTFFPASHLPTPFSNGGGGEPMTTGFTLQYDMASHGLILYAAMDVANTRAYTFFSRIILTTQSGSIQQWKQEQNIWTREESSTQVVVADVVELPEATVSRTVLEDRKETFLDRLARQTGDLQVCIRNEAMNNY
jgi:hypothetical protein